MESPFEFEPSQLPPAHFEPPMLSLTRDFAWIQVYSAGSTYKTRRKAVSRCTRNFAKRKFASYSETSKRESRYRSPLRRSIELGAIMLPQEAPEAYLSPNQVPTMQDILQSRTREPYSLNSFRRFLSQTFSDELLDFYLAVKAFKNLYKLAVFPLANGQSCDSNPEEHTVDPVYFGMLRQQLSSILSLFLVPGVADRELDLPGAIRTPLISTISEALTVYRRALTGDEPPSSVRLAFAKTVNPGIFDSAIDVVHGLLSLDKYRAFLKHVSSQNGSEGRASVSASSSRSGTGAESAGSFAATIPEPSHNPPAYVGSSRFYAIRFPSWRFKKAEKLSIDLVDVESVKSLSSSVYFRRSCFTLFKKGFF